MRLTDNQVREVRAQAAAGVTHAAIAQEHGCSTATVSGIVNGRTRASVADWPEDHAESDQGFEERASRYGGDLAAMVANAADDLDWSPEYRAAHARVTERAERARAKRLAITGHALAVWWVLNTAVIFGMQGGPL